MNKINGKQLLDAYEKSRIFAVDDPLAPEQLTAIETLFENKKKNPEAVIMIYGVYNAGKSTLINALLGKDEAAVEDIPTTDKIDSYNWQQYKLLDTPGVDAPIEHENITKAQMFQSDAVIFVVDPVGTAEELKTLSVIIDLVEGKKKVFLVFNEKKEISAEEFFKLKDQTQASLQKIASERGLQDVLKDIPMVKVNAKRALNAKIQLNKESDIKAKQGKQKLLESSNYPAFEEQITNFLESISSDELYDNLKNQLVLFLDDYTATLETQSQSAIVKNYDQMLNNISQEKEKLKQATLSDLVRHKSSIYEKTKSSLKQSPESSQLIIQQLFENSSQEISSNLSVGLKNFVQEVQSEIEELQVILPSINPKNITNSAPNFVGLDNSNDSQQSTFSEASNIDLSVVEGAVMQLGSMVKPEHIIQGLKLLKDTVPALMKGIGPVTMGKIAQTTVGRYIPMIGPIISVIGTIMDFASSSAQEKQLNQQIQEQQQAKERANQQIEDFAVELSNSFHSSMTNAIIGELEKSFSLIIEQVDSIRQSFNNAERINSQRLEQLISIQQLAKSA